MINKTEYLENRLRETGGAVVAFSAGIDSSFLLESANRALKGNVIAVIAKGSMVPESEIIYARRFCNDRKIRLIEADADEFSIEAFALNQKDRCYHCKKNIFGKIIRIACDNGFKTVLEGTNADDVSDYRPGMKALEELGVKSPLLECGFTKKEIREEARKLGIDIWDKPSAACLATRFPTGVGITPELLKKVEISEEALRKLGLGKVRVRVHGDLARIETEPEEIVRLASPEMRRMVASALKDAGFRYVSLDLCGYSTGSMNSL